MYTIGILEDEVIEQEALCMIIQTHHPDIAIGFIAENSEKARESLLHCVPDILLVDVNLPGENGLEFSKKIRGEGYEGQIIINTAYAQFEYAQSAVQIKAFDYLLKPCNPQRISDVLTACVNKLNLDESARQQQSRINQFSDSYIFEHLALGDPHLLPRLETIGWPCDGAFQALVLDFRTPGLESPIPPLHAIYHKALFLYQRTEPGHVLLVVQPRRALSCMQLRAVINLCALTGLKSLSTAQLCLVSPVCTTLEALAHQIHDLPAQPSPQGKKQIPVHFLSPAPAQTQIHKWEALEVQLSRMIRDQKFSRFRSKAELWAEKSPEDYSAFLCFFMNALCLCGMSMPYTVECQVLSPVSDTQESVAALLSVLKKELGIQDVQSSMNLALEIIKNEFDMPLSQGDIAQRLGMSQSYFSAEFKKYTKMNYIDYLTKTRMEYAQSLISQDAALTLEALASACGCTSGYYFCNVFHKYTGMTVSEYRETLEKQRKYREVNDAPLV